MNNNNSSNSSNSSKEWGKTTFLAAIKERGHEKGSDDSIDPHFACVHANCVALFCLFYCNLFCKLATAAAAAAAAAAARRQNELV